MHCGFHSVKSYQLTISFIILFLFGFLQKILEKNDAGDHFPLYAHCLGFELLTMIISKVIFLSLFSFLLVACVCFLIAIAKASFEVCFVLQVCLFVLLYYYFFHCQRTSLFSLAKHTFEILDTWNISMKLWFYWFEVFFSHSIIGQKYSGVI